MPVGPGMGVVVAMIVPARAAVPAFMPVLMCMVVRLVSPWRIFVRMTMTMVMVVSMDIGT